MNIYNLKLWMIFRCFYCTDYFWDVHQLKEHQNMHMDVEYKCELCGKNCWNRVNFYSHMALSHLKKKKKVDNPKGKFTCNICNKDFIASPTISNSIPVSCSWSKYSVRHRLNYVLIYLQKNLILFATNVAENSQPKAVWKSICKDSIRMNDRFHANNVTKGNSNFIAFN